MYACVREESVARLCLCVLGGGCSDWPSAWQSTLCVVRAVQVSVQAARDTEAEKTKQWDSLRTTLHVDVSTAVASVVSALSGLPTPLPTPSTPMHGTGVLSDSSVSLSLPLSLLWLLWLTCQVAPQQTCAAPCCAAFLRFSTDAGYDAHLSLGAYASLGAEQVDPVSFGASPHTPSLGMSHCVIHPLSSTVFRCTRGLVLHPTFR